jgi:hypothetical protein
MNLTLTPLIFGRKGRSDLDGLVRMRETCRASRVVPGECGVHP